MNRRTFVGWLIGLFFGSRLSVTPPVKTFGYLDTSRMLEPGDTKLFGVSWLVTVRQSGKTAMSMRYNEALALDYVKPLRIVDPTKLQ